MSWSVEVTGDADASGKRFDETRVASATYGMVEPEQRDIDDARDLAMTLAEKYGRVIVSASGHWNTNTSADSSSFGRCSVTITAAPEES